MEWAGGVAGETGAVEPVTDVAMFDPEYWDDAVAVEARLRARGPVHRVVQPNGLPVWVVTRYAEARAVLSDPRFAKDADELRTAIVGKLAAAGRPTELSGLFGKHMLTADPPDHTRLRRLLARDFTPGRVAELRPRVREVTDELLDRLPVGEPVDLVAELAFPLPITVIGELFGGPPERSADFHAWSSALLAASTERTIAASRAMAGYIAELVAARRAAPADDLLSALCRATEDGDRLTDAELEGTAFLLLVAGHETTAGLIGNGVLALLRDPARWRWLAAHPAAVPAVVEELLRFDGPVRTTTPRFTREPVTVGGTAIPAGEVVLVVLTSANRDPDRFADPELLDLDRPAGGHLAFGHGIHHCLGAPLARMEAEVALGRLLARYPDATLAADPTTLRRRTSVTVNSLLRLPVQLAASA